MKKILIALGLAVAALSASAQVSISLGGRISPGVYGSVNLGDLGGRRPDVVYAQPQVLYPDANEDLYIYVPVEQQRDWRRYCWKYQACHRRVYFVQDAWVRNYHNNWEQRQRMEQREMRHDQWQDRHQMEERQRMMDQRMQEKRMQEQRHMDDKRDHQDEGRGQGDQRHDGDDHRGH